MKKIYIALTCMSILGGTTACSDFLEENRNRKSPQVSILHNRIMHVPLLINYIVLVFLSSTMLMPMPEVR